MAALHDSLACIDDTLEAEIRLNAVADRIRRLLIGKPFAPPATSDRRLAERLRGNLDEHLFERLTMATAATAIGADPTRLARAFVDAFGIPPHVYVMGRRIEAARDRILDGQPLADVAAETGFFDQAHLTRRFTAFLGVTPGQYRRQGTPRHWRLAAPAVSGTRPVTAAG